MYTIKENKIYEYEIKKSKFIALLYKISSIDEINDIISKVRKNYKDATHCCYSYYLDQNYHFSDDGEPGGTAGLPITQVLKNNNITNVLCIVVRYFGGIKLGAGGLVRAYTKATVNVLNEAEMVELVDGYIIEIEICYDEVKGLDNILKDITIVDKIFNDKIIYKIKLEKDKLSLISKYNYKILKEEKIEKVKLN